MLKSLFVKSWPQQKSHCISHTTYLSLKFEPCSYPPKCSSISQSGTGTGTLRHSCWWPLWESRPLQGPVCTFCAVSFPVWVDHTACSVPCPSFRLAVRSVAEWTGVLYLSAYERDHGDKYLHSYWELLKGNCWYDGIYISVRRDVSASSLYHLEKVVSQTKTKLFNINSCEVQCTVSVIYGTVIVI